MRKFTINVKERLKKFDKFIGEGVKSIFINTLILGSLVSCIPGANVVTDGGQCGENQHYNAISRQCEAVTNQAPSGTLVSEQIFEDSGANNIILTYNDVDNDPAIACQVLTYGAGIGDNPPNPCTCASGVCSVPVTPDTNYSGTTSLSYRVIDGNGFSEVQTVSIEVVSVNDAPVVSSIDTVGVDEMTSKAGDVSGFVTDVEQSSFELTFSLLSNAIGQHGELVFLANGHYTYYPKNDALTHDPEDETFYFQVCDSGQPILCDSGALRFRIDPVNDVPTTSSYLGAQTTNEDTSIVITVPVGMDREGDIVHYVKDSDPSVAGSSLTDCLNEVGVGVRTCTYHPKPDYFGTDSFRYKLCNDVDGNSIIDGNDECSAPITVAVIINSVNDAPDAGAAITVVTDEDVNIIDFAVAGSDIDSTNLSYQVVTGPGYGTVSFTDNKFTYEPNSDINNDSIWIDSGNMINCDSFTFKVCDDLGACSADQTVTIDINPLPDAPTITLSQVDYPQPADYPLSVPLVSMNEGGSFNILGIKVDEGGASDEDDEELMIFVSVSQHADVGSIDPALILPINSSDNSHIDVRYQGSSVGGAGSYPLAGNFVDLGDGTNNAKDGDLDLIITPVGGLSGKVVVTISVCQYEAPLVSCSTVDSTQIFDFSVNSVTAIHGGWKHIKAVGAKRDHNGNVVSYARDENGAIVMNGSNPTYRSSARVELEWNPMIIAGTANPGVTIDGWKVYRRLTGQDYNWDQPHAVISDASIRKYIDTDFSDSVFWDGDVFKSTVLYYVVRPVDSDEGLSVPTAEVFSEVRVIAPPDNMVFVHRWIVNQEVCDKMHLGLSNNGIDTVNNFRCLFAGPGSTTFGSDDYYDIGYDLLVDISEAGCPYDTVGVGDPNSEAIGGSDGFVYYDRGSGVCYIYDDANLPGSKWDKFSGDDASDTIENTVSNNTTIANKTRAVFLPPLVQVTSGNASDICRSRSGIAIEGLSGATARPYLPSRKQQMAYSAWSSELSDTLTNEYEEGFAINGTSKCNSSQANGIEDGYTDGMPGVSYRYSLPGSETSSIRSIYTGSEELGAFKLTPACSSRYGVQDIFGNVFEWVSDQMECGTRGSATAGLYKCQGINRVGPANPTTNDWLTSDGVTPYGFNTESGVCADGNGDEDCDDIYDDTFMVSWFLKDASYFAKRFSFPLGLPYHGNHTSGDSTILINDASGITTTRLRNDYVSIYAENLELESNGGATIATGGSYLSGAKAGRYSLEFVPKTYVGAVAGEYTYELSSYPGSNQGIIFSADEQGQSGNSITITIQDSGSLDAAVDDPAVEVDGSAVNIDVDTTLFSGHTTLDVVNAVNNDPDASALIDASLDSAALVDGPAGQAYKFQNRVLYTAVDSGVDGRAIHISIVNDDTVVAGSEVITQTDSRSVHFAIDQGVTTTFDLCNAVMAHPTISTTLFDCNIILGYANGVEYRTRTLTATNVQITTQNCGSPSFISEDPATGEIIVCLYPGGGADRSEDIVNLINNNSSLIAARVITPGAVQDIGVNAIILSGVVPLETLLREDVAYTTTSLLSGGEQVTVTINSSAAPDSVTVDVGALTVDINLDTAGAMDSTTVVGLLNGLPGVQRLVSVVDVTPGTPQTTPATFTVDADFVPYLTSLVYGADPLYLDDDLSVVDAGYFTVAPLSTLTLNGGVDNLDSKREDIGFRCVVPISNSEYGDANHKAGYSYD